MDVKHIDGQNKGNIMLYAISTCGWCKKTKKFLKSLGVEYRYIDVDMLEPAEKKKIDGEVMKWNPQRNYPMIVINNKKCIVGYKEDEIKEALHL
ncbi:Glutaredoxin [uncultured archaeon]|nr:Glutaredoxin [uncultured archaeon]